MEARIIRAVTLAAVLLVSMGARHRSANFVVETPDPAFAKQVADAAERYRRQLAVEWLGRAMPNWSQPCMMTVRAGPNLGPGGATTFVFDRGEVFGWRMTIQGSRQRLLDSVLPHEITHTIFASHFRQPLPRWADEGGATSVEHVSERNKYRKMLYRFLQTGHGIAFNRMFAMRDYPRNPMPLYAQGYSVAEHLIQQYGRRKYVEFLRAGLRSGDWSGALHQTYGIADVAALQHTWLAWVRQGSPTTGPRRDQPAIAAAGDMLALASATPPPADRRKRSEPKPSFAIPATESPAFAVGGSSPYAAGSAIPANDAARSSPEQPAAAKVPPRQLPPTGWQAIGTRPGAPARVADASPPPRPSEPAVRTHVTRPQPLEQSRQIILEWSSR